MAKRKTKVTVKKAATRPKVSPEQANKSVMEIQKYYRLGQKYVEKIPERGAYGDQAMTRYAKERGWNLTKLRKARQFADPSQGYSQKQLDELCNLIRKHRSVFGISYVSALVSISWGEGRAELQDQCIKNNWTARTLEAEIKRRRGYKGEGGRRYKVGDSVGLALIQLKGVTTAFCGWLEDADDQPLAGEGDQTVFQGLPVEVKKLAKRAQVVMEKLKDLVDGIIAEGEVTKDAAASV